MRAKKKDYGKAKIEKPKGQEGVEERGESYCLIKDNILPVGRSPLLPHLYNCFDTLFLV